MKRPDFDDLIGEGLAADERDRLAQVDALLRSVGPPPAEVPGSLTRAVEGIPARRRAWGPGRTALAIALAAALAALFFGVGRWTNGNGENYRASIPMRATGAAHGAAATLRIGDRNAASGNWKVALTVSGLPKLAGNDYYVLWLAKDGKYAGTCGTFNVGKGTTTVDMTVSYRLQDYDAWVISRHADDSPWLLAAKI
jgi:Anti-sigma-K factor rskA